MRVVTIGALRSCGEAFAQQFEAAAIQRIEPGTPIHRVRQHGGPGTDDPTTWIFENGSLITAKDKSGRDQRGFPGDAAETAG